MNKERRRVVGNIFGDAAKYTLTAGVIGGILSDRYSLILDIGIAGFFTIFLLLAYFITPKDGEIRWSCRYSLCLE
jgi:hypothetical protein